MGAAERAWKVFSFIHDRRRNRLTKDRAEKLVWLHYNLRIIGKVHNQDWEEVMHAIPDEDADDAELDSAESDASDDAE